MLQPVPSALYAALRYVYVLGCIARLGLHALRGSDKALPLTASTLMALFS